MAIITLNSSNDYRDEIEEVLYPQNISWNTPIPEGGVIRIEYENGAFIDLKSVYDSGSSSYVLKVMYSNLVSGDNGGNSTFQLIDEANEIFNIFLSKE
jgi:hypothetical protein